MENVIKQALARLGITEAIEMDGKVNLLGMFQPAVTDFGPSPAFSSLGHSLNFTELG